MKTDIFADTSGWAEFFLRTEPFHQEAKQLMQQWYSTGTPIITTNYILLELIALLTSPLKVPRVQQMKIIETIQSATWVKVIHIDLATHQQAWQLLTKRLDKTWSLTDCSSFVIMQNRIMTQALTTDHHQAGFVRLLK